jgi:glycosyltransferase EpsD
MKQVMRQGDYDIIWTNEPVMGVVTRFCARKIRRTGTKVLYMAHGFHFYDGAPLQNWLIYYPIERMMAQYTDVIVTVNSEDYYRARTFRTKDVKYIHGIGINTERLTRNGNIDGIRRELNLPNDAFVVLSVGELNKNKNHSTIIRAISRMNDPQVHYLVCGKGDTYDKLCRLSKKLSVEGNIHFLGYRRDVVDICSQADVYVMPSFREGLPVSSLEAMYCGLPLLTSNIRGLVDVNKNGENGYLYDPIDVGGFSTGIEKLKSSPQLRREMGQRNKQVVIPFTLENTKKEVLEIINELIS